MSTARQQAAKKTRDKIIQSAMEIVGKSGYKALTSNALVAHAGVAKGTIYHHFDSLDDVIFAMIRSICSQMVNDISEHQYTSLKGYFSAIGEYNIDECANNRELINIIFGFFPIGMKDQKFKTLATELIEADCQQTTAVIQSFYHEKLSKEKLDHAVRMIDMFSAGFVIHNTLFDNPELYKQIWQEFGDMLIFYLEK